jgi:hypothetical protein
MEREARGQRLRPLASQGILKQTLSHCGGMIALIEVIEVDV